MQFYYFYLFVLLGKLLQFLIIPVAATGAVVLVMPSRPSRSFVVLLLGALMTLQALLM